MAVATAPDIRARCIASLHPAVAEHVNATDAVEAAVRVHLEAGGYLPPALRAVLVRLVRARDAYLNPLVEAAEEGRE